MATDPSPRRVRSTASDVPDRFPDVDAQLRAEYGDDFMDELIRQQKEGGR